MEQGTAVNKADKWDALAETWHDSGPPASPSHQDIRIYAKFLRQAVKSTDGQNIMLLGCTPHIRVLLNRMKLFTTCVDISEKMLSNTTATLPRTITREKQVCQDWLEMDFEGSQFSAIVGDKILDNVPYTEWPKLKERILRHLVPKGFFITRVAPQDISLIGQSFKELLGKWALLYESQHVPIREITSGLWEQALGASTLSVPGRQSISVFAEEIKALEIRKDELKASEAAILMELRGLFAKSFQYEWTAYTLGGIVDAFAEELVLIALERASDYPVAKRQPILMFRAT